MASEGSKMVSKHMLEKNKKGATSKMWAVKVIRFLLRKELLEWPTGNPGFTRDIPLVPRWPGGASRRFNWETHVRVMHDTTFRKYSWPYLGAGWGKRRDQKEAQSISGHSSCQHHIGQFVSGKNFGKGPCCWANFPPTRRRPRLPTLPCLGSLGSRSRMPNAACRRPQQL